jgi:hypothetical protein
VEAEDGWIDAMGCVGALYPKIIVFSILCARDNLVFCLIYKKDPRGMMLLTTSSNFILIFEILENE